MSSNFSALCGASRHSDRADEEAATEVIQDVAAYDGEPFMHDASPWGGHGIIFQVLSDQMRVLVR